ncbi:MAG: phosphomannomutase/phosphoglucomutase [Candidatus Pacebacteria bacterium]|nr:phosphomannomutase/phosphoglucomutase [Candidatus Paceibacterota bacterium]
MLVNPSIFKSYDIRGIFEEDFDADFAYKLGLVFASFSKAKSIAVAYDARLSSVTLYKALVKGLIKKGVNVYSLKLAPTECLYFAVGNYKYDAGIMITASHNPKEYNGFKMILNKDNDISIVRGSDISEFFKQEMPFEENEEGKIEEIEFEEDFLSHIFSFIEPKKIKPLKVVIDIGNGAMGDIISKVSKRIPISLIPMNFEPNGNFPSRSPNPLFEGANKKIKEKIKEEKANVGFMFDGDGDRIFMLDEKGNFISADVSLLLLAKFLLEKEPGFAVSYNLICSKAVPELISKWKGIPIRTAVGFINVREGILKERGIMGGELSGHYCFRDNFYLDSGVMAYLILLSLCSEKNMPVSEIVKEFTLYAKSSEINFKAQNKEEILEKIKEKYFDGKQDYLDGVTVEYDSFWFNVRASQTEPLLRLTIEADSEELLEKKKKEVVSFISENSK